MTATGSEPAGIVPPARLTTRALIRLVAPTWFAVQVKPAVRSVQAAPAPEASWSSSGLSSSENVRPRTAMGLSSEIGTWMPAAPGSPQTSDPVSTTRSGVVDVVVDVLVVVDGPLLVVDDEVVVVVSGAVEVVEEDEERLPSGPVGPEGTEVRRNSDGDDRPARGLPEVQTVGQPGEAARGDMEAKETVARRLADRNRRVDLVYAETDLELAEPIAA